MSHYLDQIRDVGNALDRIDVTSNPQKARALLKRRRVLKHVAEAARERAIAFQARQRASGEK
jgi:hypothetical protein